MNEFSITPFRGPHLLLLLLTAAAVLLIFLLLRGKSEVRRSRYLIGVCFFNLALFAVYKLSLSLDAAYIRAYYPNGFSIFNELPLHLCNINLFLIPLGVWKRNVYFKNSSIEPSFTFVSVLLILILSHFMKISCIQTIYEDVCRIHARK